MKRCKHYILVLWSSMFMFVQTSHAQWPVFDFTEIVPIVEDIKAGIGTVLELKAQIEEKIATLNAIGQEMSSFSSFSKGLKKGLAIGLSIAGEAALQALEDEEIMKKATEEASKATSETLDTQNNLVEDYVDQTQSTVDDPNAANLSFLLISDSFKVCENNIIFEEEEEEEEVETTTQTSAVEEEINILQSTAMLEQKQLADELNDILDEQLTLLNKSALNSERVLNKLSTTIRDIKKINQDDKERIQEKIVKISQKQRKTSDQAIKIVEEIKDNYNKEYNNQIKDGMNNYTKVVIAYAKGDASSESMVNAGNMLKKNVSSINVTPNADVLNKLYANMADVRLEIENLVAEISEFLENIKDF